MERYYTVVEFCKNGNSGLDLDLVRDWSFKQHIHFSWLFYQRDSNLNLDLWIFSVAVNFNLQKFI